ncbi:MAG: radical SAM protein [Desulfobacterales bacterium]|jgi:MoaA/NifB/PqqE/SkfB family radical SAM enzyme
MIRYLKELLPKMMRYRLARRGILSPGSPFNLTFSITNICQSKCKTCNIWELYDKQPEKRNDELSLEEINKIFHSMGHVYVFNISGGEPFLRTDLVEVIASACKHLAPGVVHIPTNALAKTQIENKTKEILNVIQTHCALTQLTIKPSLDHIGPRHDEIRGVKGNYNKVMDVFQSLKALQKDYPNFHVELGTVISRWNIGDVQEIAQHVTQLGVDSYRNEIAEQRSEMFNTQNDITPDPEQYEKAISYFVGQIRENMKNRVFFQRITNAFRLIYYDLAIRILKENRQVIPCYAGISNVHMTPYGDIWACCTLGYDKPIGNLRDCNYDFQSLWNSPKAKEVRTYIREGQCNCPMANQTYSNMLMHGPSLFRVLREILKTK